MDPELIRGSTGRSENKSVLILGKKLRQGFHLWWRLTLWGVEVEDDT